MPLTDNPFRPAPVSEPPALVGRDEEMSAARYSLSLTQTGAPAQPIVFVGLRGMGKTALLRRCIKDAQADSAIVVYGEATDREPLSRTLQRGIERAQRDNASLPQKLKSGFDRVLDALPRASYELPNDMGAVSLSGPHREDKALLDALDGFDPADQAGNSSVSA